MEKALSHLSVEDVGQILEKALSTLGLSESYLLAWIELPSPEGVTFLKKENLGVHKWIAICEALYLPLNSLSIGYHRNMHLAQIRRAVEGGYFRLPKTPNIQCVLKEIRRQKKQNAHFLALHYGFRLRWKIRIGQLLREAQRRR